MQPKSTIEPPATPAAPASGPGNVAIQGELGSFSHAAACLALGADVQVLPQASFDALFAAVLCGQATRGLVPVENTLAGTIHENYDRLRQQPVHVVGETQIHVEQCLIARPGASLASIRRVASHPVALAQCRRFFAAHPNIEPVPVYDTAGSVRDIMQGGLQSQAAIASRLAAEIYGARVLAAGIQDDVWNITRFLLVSAQAQDIPEADKTSLAFRLPQAPGTLHRALSCFAQRGLDLTKIESRPLPGPPWDYVFYLDVLGAPEGALAGALAELQGFSYELRVLGSYRQALVRDPRPASDLPPLQPSRAVAVDDTWA